MKKYKQILKETSTLSLKELQIMKKGLLILSDQIRSQKELYDKIPYEKEQNCINAVISIISRFIMTGM